MSRVPCRGCEAKTAGSSGLCPACKWGRRLGYRYATRYALTVEQVIVGKPGSAWCAWDKVGNVLAGPADTKDEVQFELAELERREPRRKS